MNILRLEPVLFYIAMAIYALATVFYVLGAVNKKEWGRIASLVLRAGFLVHTAFLIVRTINVARVPFVGHFEFGNLFIWATVMVYTWSEWRLKERYYMVGTFLMPLVMIYVSYLTIIPRLIPSITVSMEHSPLPPVLQSDWLKIHVAASVLGYAGFSLAFAVALMWLIRNYLGVKGLPEPKVLEEYMYRASVFGFLFQTVMIITGAIWADTSWGRYWGWDPKEMWALITWFVYAVYLHARFTRGWHGKRTVALVVVGWFAMMFTWLGVAWLLSGIHSFG